MTQGASENIMFTILDFFFYFKELRFEIDNKIAFNT